MNHIRMVKGDALHMSYVRFISTFTLNRDTKLIDSFFAIFMPTDNHVELGCVKDLKDRYEECLKNPNACVICETENCNKEDRKNFGHRITATILLNAFVVFVLFLHY